MAMINIHHLIRCCSLSIHAVFVLVSYLPSLKARKPVRKKRGRRNLGITERSIIIFIPRGYGSWTLSEFVEE